MKFLQVIIFTIFHQIFLNKVKKKKKKFNLHKNK
jgi:hypothetical protein